MFVVDCDGFGDVSVLKIKKENIPELKNDEIMIKIQATALNRADIMQRKGFYPSPPGTSKILGLEASGYRVDKNGNILREEPIMCLLPGGGYAEYAAINKNHIIPIPKNISIEDASAIPEAWLTAYLNFKLANLDKNKNVLIYAGASGVGTALIQICNLYGVNCFVTCSNDEKVLVCEKLGAKKAFNYKKISNEDILSYFSTVPGSPLKIDAVIDCVGTKNFDLTSGSLNIDGKWVLYGLLSGGIIEKFDLSILMKKRVSLITTTLKNRCDKFKTELINEFKNQILPYFETNQLKLVIDKKFNVTWDSNGEELVKKAHIYMESNESIGKILLVFPKL